MPLGGRGAQMPELGLKQFLLSERTRRLTVLGSGLLMFMTASVVRMRMGGQGGGLEDATRGARGGPPQSSLQLGHHSPTKAKQANFPKSPHLSP